MPTLINGKQMMEQNLVLEAWETLQFFSNYGGIIMILHIIISGSFVVPILELADRGSINYWVAGSGIVLVWTLCLLTFMQIKAAEGIVENSAAFIELFK